MAGGVATLTRDKTRKSGKPPLPAAIMQRVVDLALGPPPGAVTRWSGRMLAKAVIAALPREATLSAGEQARDMLVASRIIPLRLIQCCRLLEQTAMARMMTPVRRTSERTTISRTAQFR
jgi:hypothetical protein